MLVDNGKGDICVIQTTLVVQVHPQCPCLEQDEAQYQLEPDSTRVGGNVNQRLAVREFWDGRQHLNLHGQKFRWMRLRNVSI